MTHPKHPLLTRRAAHRVMPLEARLMFDAAAAAEASRPTEAAVGDAPPATAAAPAAAAAAARDTQAEASLVAVNPGLLAGPPQQGLAQALEQVNAALARLPAGQSFAPLVAEVFGHTGTDAATFARRVGELSEALAAGGLKLQVELRGNAELQGAYAAYAAHAPDGAERIYLNADWVGRGATQADIARVLLEEVGHAIDQRLNAGVDTPGDEGERFSALLRGESVGALRDQALLADADRTALTIDGARVDVEFSELSVPFSEGFIGTQGNSSGKADGILNFATLGIVRASFFQDAGSGNAFTPQGNDIPGGLRLTLSSGSVITISGAINWRVTSGSTLHCFGFVPDPSTAPVQFSYGGGSSFTISSSSNFGLELVGASYSAPDNSNVSGNAATSGLLSALNTYLATVQANDPNGPVTVNTLTTSSTTPTLTGLATLGAGESLNVQVNGVTYTTGTGLTVGGGSWSLTIPGGNALTVGTTYSVTATIVNGAGYTLADTSINELVIQAPDNTAPVVGAGQSFNYVENQTTGATLGTVAATDASGVTGYRFAGSGTATSSDGYFSINAAGQISLTTAGAAAAANDYETLPNSFTHAVQARDAAGNWSSAVDVTLNVTDVDDSAPVVTANQSFSYAENRASGAVLGTVAATDAVGVTGYRFGSTGTGTSSDGYYSINAFGQISLTTAGAAAAANDYEALPNSFTHAVQARDAAGNWSSAVDVTLNVTDVDDSAPVVAANQSFSYAENQASGAVLGTVAATDAVGVTGYRFSSTGTGTSTDGYYSIDASGQISLTTAGAAAAANDYEALPNSFTHGVQARDAAGNWSSAVNITLNVTDVDDSAPVVAANQSFSYAENQASGAVLGTVAATDAVGVTGYRFAGTGTATSSDGWFSIDTAGRISLTTAGAAAAANDYETLPNSFTHAVQARDAAGNWSAAVDVALDVTDVNENTSDGTPPVVAANQSFSYAENQSAGTTLCTVAATDDVGVTGYRFSSTGMATSADGYFSIDAAGQVSLTTAGAAAAANDYETLPNSFTHGVQARDAAGNWSSAINVTLHVTDVDDSAPVVAANQSLSYAENQISGAVLGTVAATDAVGATGYRFAGTGTTTSSDGWFSIDTAGRISLTSAGAAAAANDYETLPNSFIHAVQARDAAGNWSAAVDVTLDVTDVNENTSDGTPPVVAANQSFGYAENQRSGAVLGTVAATDAVGVTGYRFGNSGTTTSSDGYFSIDTAGRISLTTAGAAAAANDYETLPNGFTHAVQARDAAGNWSGAVDVRLNVTDVDDTAPVVAPSQSFGYAENQASGAVLGTVTATDAVGVTGYRFGRTGTTTSPDGYFGIDAKGQISLTTAGAAAAANDHETLPNGFTHAVQARDAAGNWSSAVDLTLNVTDVDDTAPVVAPSQSFGYAENQASGAVLGTVVATDAVGVTGYRFGSTGTATSSDGYFDIDAAGRVSLTTAGAAAAANDYETLPNGFIHAVQARDAAGSWSIAVDLTLNVTDVDDTAPVVAPSQGFSYAENQTGGAVLGTVAATDAVGITGYRFSSTGTEASADGHYRIDASGRISLTTAGTAGAANDHETLPNGFNHAVQARDAAGNWSNAVEVTLNVTDVDEFAVVPDRIETAEDTPASGNVLRNDTGGPASVVSFAAGGSTVAAGGTLQLTGVGSITLAADGNFVFTPLPDWHGSVPTIAYLTDRGQTSGLDIVVSPVNDAPVLARGALTTFRDVAREGQLPAATDADGDRPAYRLVQDAEHGTVTVDATGRYRYVPAAGHVGADRFRVEVSDGHGGSTQAWVDVTVDAPPTLSLPARWDLGVSDSDRTTSADVIALAGTGVPGQTLQLFAPTGAPVGSIVVDAGGQWSVAGIDLRTTRGDGGGAAPGAPGAYTFTLRAALPDGLLGTPVQLTVQREVVVATVPREPAPAPVPVAAEPPAPAPAAPAVASEPRLAFDSTLRPESRPDGVPATLRPSEPAAQPAFALPVRDANAADIYTRPSGFQVMVNPSPEPSLKVFRGLDDQVAKLGAAVQLQLPADTFIHTQVNETIVLQATLADGRPLPRWLQFDGRTGTLSGLVPAEWRQDLVIRIVARDGQGREATAMMRLKVAGEPAGTTGGLSRQLMQGRSTPLAAGRAPALRA